MITQNIFQSLEFSLRVNQICELNYVFENLTTLETLKVIDISYMQWGLRHTALPSSLKAIS